jgi:hypothetical protein
MQMPSRQQLRDWFGQINSLLPNTNLWLALFTGMLVVVAGLQTCILSSTDAALHKSADAVSDAAKAVSRSVDIAEATERAWIAPVRFALAAPADSDDPLKVRVSYQNVGREPARSAKNWLGYGYIPLSPPLPSPANWGELPGWYASPAVQPKEICEHLGKIHKTSVVYPSTTIGFSIDTTKDPALPIPVEEIKQQHAVYFVVGCFSYETVGRTRFSSFCAFLAPSAAKDFAEWGFNACPVGNDDY